MICFPEHTYGRLRRASHRTMSASGQKQTFASATSMSAKKKLSKPAPTPKVWKQTAVLNVHGCNALLNSILNHRQQHHGGTRLTHMPTWLAVQGIAVVIHGSMSSQIEFPFYPKRFEVFPVFRDQRP